jgi:O-antigen ligase
LEAWASGLEMFKSSPLYGVGFNNFADIFGITAHNSFVLCLAELGLLGSTLWMALLVTTTISLNRIIGGRKPRLAKLFGFVPIFESRYIGTAGALHSAVALSAPGIMAMSEVNTGERAVTIEAASAAENEIPIELHSSPVVPMQWIEVIRLALISFMATAWFLSRSYTTTMYLVLGLATAAIALEENDSKTTDRGHWIFLSVAAEVVLVVLIYFLVRLRHP